MGISRRPLSGEEQRIECVYIYIQRRALPEERRCIHVECRVGGGLKKRKHVHNKVEPTLPPFGGATWKEWPHENINFRTERFEHNCLCKTNQIILECTCHPCADLKITETNCCSQQRRLKNRWLNRRGFKTNRQRFALKPDSNKKDSAVQNPNLYNHKPEYTPQGDA